MKRQKVFIMMDNGAVLMFEGPVQYDVDAAVKPKVRKISFGRPAERESLSAKPPLYGEDNPAEILARMFGARPEDRRR